MDWELISEVVENYFGANRTALVAAIHEIALPQAPTYLDAVMAEEGSPTNREQAVVWWSKRRGDLWR